MQILLSMMLIAQPPVVPDGPPAVPDQHPADSLPIVFPTGDFKADAERWIRSSEPLPPPPKAEKDDGFTVDWPDGTWIRAVNLHKIADLSGAVSISGPWHGRHTRYERLSNPTRIEVTAALETARETLAAERSVSQTATGKSWPLPSARHDDSDAAGPWPDSVPFPEGMKRYKRASMTQEIAVTNGYDRISPVHRLDLHARDSRWLVSGGLLGIDGFRSDLYRNEAAANSREYVGNIGVLNSFGSIQQNRGWRREFADGSKFLDVLSKDGEVFEIRQREKLYGRWNSEVIYENEKVRPVGYSGLAVSCTKCHNSRDGAGTGPYAGPLVTGSDTVLSYPFKALEKP